MTDPTPPDGQAQTYAQITATGPKAAGLQALINGIMLGDITQAVSLRTKKGFAEMTEAEALQAAAQKAVNKIPWGKLLAEGGSLALVVQPNIEHRADPTDQWKTTQVITVTVTAYATPAQKPEAIE